MIDRWPISSYSYDRELSGSDYDLPALGVCFDTGKIGPGRYGMRCWEILWRATDPRQIARSALFEGHLLESENVYCLAFQNADVRRLEHIVAALEASDEFALACASPSFILGEKVMHEPLVSAGELDVRGALIGISYDARLSLNKVKREKMAARRPDALSGETPAGFSACAGQAASAPAAMQGQARKWWHVW